MVTLDRPILVFGKMLPVSCILRVSNVTSSRLATRITAGSLDVVPPTLSFLKFAMDLVLIRSTFYGKTSCRMQICSV